MLAPAVTMTKYWDSSDAKKPKNVNKIPVKRPAFAKPHGMKMRPEPTMPFHADVIVVSELCRFFGASSSL